MNCRRFRSPGATGVSITLFLIVSVISAIKTSNVPEINTRLSLRRVPRSDDVDGSFSWRDLSPRLDNRALTRDNDFMQKRRKKCNNRIQIENGRRRILEQGSLVRFRCEYGYILFGASVAACVRGQWSEPPPVCISAGCRRPQLPHGIIGRPLFGGAAIVFECFPGYQMQGDSTIVCDGLRWNGTLPTCTTIITPSTMTPPSTVTSKATTGTFNSETSTTLEDDQDNHARFPSTGEPLNEEMSATEDPSFKKLEMVTGQQTLENKPPFEVHTTTMTTLNKNLAAHQDTTVVSKGVEFVTEPAVREIFPTSVNSGATSIPVASSITPPAPSTAIPIRKDYGVAATRTTPSTTVTRPPITIPSTTSSMRPTTIISKCTISDVPVSAAREFSPQPVLPAGEFTTDQSLAPAGNNFKSSSTVRSSTTVQPVLKTGKIISTQPPPTVTKSIAISTAIAATITKYTIATPGHNTSVQSTNPTEKRTTTVITPLLKFPEIFNNVTTTFKNSTRNSTSENTAKASLIRCALMFRNRKQQQQLRECLQQHLNSTSSARAKPTPSVWRNRLRIQTSRPLLFKRNNTRSQTWAPQTTLIFKIPTRITTSSTTTAIPVNVTARVFPGSTTVSASIEDIFPTNRLSLTSYQPSEEFDNTIEQVLRKPKETEKIESGVEEKPISGVVFYYCWTRNKGIARRSRYESDGRNLSVHLDMDEEFVYFGNNR
ncbi:unnamed protein product [Allacma fusca]|uniref:Sushi domain-containing protein n=1 Tax=Allacma fusca TaxID=39272 RepID=A0A8J2K9Q8_9HEXA|nr:unnamed protein product [Allacma fusca]